VVSTLSQVRPADSLDRVVDPEIPVLTIRDLGILRDVVEHPSGTVEVVITPTYSGCPAMDVIREDIVRNLAADGYGDVTVTTVLSPAWTTDWMTDEGRRKLDEYGIAPPTHRARTGPVPVTIGVRRTADVACPRCGSPGREISRFGSTACKAHYVCSGCGEPFDHFKTI
jgi:ring-1,2-phenylacetyl-CoA epoxidase subunit PaaD